MLRNVYLTCLLTLIFGSAAWAQSGSIKGRVLDKTTNEPLPFASVIAVMNGQQMGGAQTDFDGNFTIKPLGAGTYSVKATFVGYTTTEVTGVLVSVDKITFADVKMGKGAVDITAVEVTAYKVPLIDKGNPAVQTTITQEEIKAIPTRDVRSVAATAAGVFQRDEGDDLNVRGSRDDATDYYIDGVKVRGSSQLPQSAIEQVTVITGGVPAQYGDATGGIISITTRGPSKKYTGGIELATSELTDKFGYNLASGNISGPLYMKKDKDGNKTPVIGFFLGVEGEWIKDPDPSAIGSKRVKGSVLTDLENNPLMPNMVNGTINGTRARSEFIHSSDIETMKYKPNTRSGEYKVSGNIDFQPANNINIKVGGSYDYHDYREYTYTYSLFNYKNYSRHITNDYRGYLRFTQRFNTEGKEGSKSILKNVYYSLQFDYSKAFELVQSEQHKDRLFDYGYWGRFNTLRRPVFAGNELLGYLPYLTVFTPSGNNPNTEAYTNQYLSFFDENYAAHANEYYETGNTSQFTNTAYYSNPFVIRAGGGLINGQRAGTVYSMWYNTGRTIDGYNYIDRDQYRASAMFSADIKNHAISLGFEYEQRVDRQFNIAPSGLWTFMNNYANFYLNEANPEAGSYTINDTIYHPNTYTNTTGQIGFYENVRKQLGLSNTEYVDVFNYDPSNFSLSMFSPDELGTSGLTLYYGYDYKGNRQKTLSPSATFDNFFKKDANGVYQRNIAAFQPIYLAGYIQDNFSINDLIFNVGLRVDRFDANQRVMKDPYLLYQAYTAGELNFQRPDNIGSDYVVYVSDFNVDKNTLTANDILGYRSGDQWYDKNGVALTDPRILERQSSSARVLPLLVNKDEDIKSGNYEASKTFKDYEPQLTFMPRVAFQFDINDQAQFFANYSILTQRPAGRLRNDPWAYYNFEQGSTISNPNLKPEKSVNYELGFRQILSRSSVITISAFYRELKQMLQLRNIFFSYPGSGYTTFDNIDFGTVKGLTLGYDLRRTGNVRLGASYTLQFADGTGSSDVSGADLLSTGQAGLRVILPLDFDQRHNITVSFDYRYQEGKNYNGPVLFGKQIFANTGARLEFKAGSGTPYSRQYTPTFEGNNIGVQTQGNSKIKGDINSARLPWNSRFDLKVDKDFALNFDKDKKTKYYLNVYVQVQNLLNQKNIISVYRYTGNPDDDGYLGSSLGQDYLESLEASGGDPQAFSDLYAVKINNPDNYARPRTVRVGLSFNF